MAVGFDGKYFPGVSYICSLLHYWAGVNEGRSADCRAPESSNTVIATERAGQDVDNGNISESGDNRAVPTSPQDVSRTLTPRTNNTGSRTAFIEPSYSSSSSSASSHQPSPTEHCVNICSEADQTCNRSIALALTPTTATPPSKVAATGGVQRQAEEGTCASGSNRSAQQSDVTNCKLRLGTNGVTEQVVAHLIEEVVHGKDVIRNSKAVTDSNSSKEYPYSSSLLCDCTDPSEKIEVTKKLLGSNRDTDKVVDQSDSCTKRCSALSRMAYHEHTLESMRPDSPLSASMSLLSRDTSSLHNNDDIDSPRHDTQIHMEVSFPFERRRGLLLR